MSFVDVTSRLTVTALFTVLLVVSTILAFPFLSLLGAPLLLALFLSAVVAMHVRLV